MPLRQANAIWKGDLNDGGGSVKLGSGTYEGPYTFKGRVESDEGTNPEELLGSALAACYAMFLSAKLSGAGYTVNKIDATAAVELRVGDDGLKVSGITLTVEGDVSGVDEAKFREVAEASKSKSGCPISVAIAVPITLDAKLV